MIVNCSDEVINVILWSGTETHFLRPRGCTALLGSFKQKWSFLWFIKIDLADSKFQFSELCLLFELLFFKVGWDVNSQMDFKNFSAYCCFDFRAPENLATLFEFSVFHKEWVWLLCVPKSSFFNVLSTEATVLYIERKRGSKFWLNKIVTMEIYGLFLSWDKL